MPEIKTNKYDGVTYGILRELMRRSVRRLERSGFYEARRTESRGEIF
jgi:hypothetical protein